MEDITVSARKRRRTGKGSRSYGMAEEDAKLYRKNAKAQAIDFMRAQLGDGYDEQYASGIRPRFRSYKAKDGTTKALIGYGKYNIRSLGRSIAKAIPRGTFAKMGSSLGGPAGGFLGSALSSLTGFGAYRAHNIDEGGRPPTIMNGNDGSFVVSHQTQVANVYASTGFEVTRYDINPGNSKLFPWLSAIARNFSQYRLEGMIVQYKSTSAESSNSANTALGTVTFATDYDVSVPVVTNKFEMTQLQQSVQTRPSENLTHVIECDPAVTNNRNFFYIHDGVQPLPPNSSKKEYDYASMFIATDGMQISGGVPHQIGEVWVSYQVRLLRPRMAPPQGLFSQWTINSAGTFGNDNATGTTVGTRLLDPAHEDRDLGDVSAQGPIITTGKGSSTSFGWSNGSNLGLEIHQQTQQLTISFGEFVREGVFEFELLYQDLAAPSTCPTASIPTLSVNPLYVALLPMRGDLSGQAEYLVASGEDNAAQTCVTLKFRFRILKNTGDRTLCKVDITWPLTTWVPPIISGDYGHVRVSQLPENSALDFSNPLGETRL